MNKARIIIIIIVVALIAWFAFSGSKGPSNDGATNNPDLAKVDVVDAKPVESPSFTCSDNTKFTAEFITEEEVSIKVDGTVVRTLSFVGPGLVFSANGYTYAFKNEDVSVTNAQTKKTATCTQVAEAGKTAMNFGDGTVQKDPLAIVKKAITGKWTSDDSASSTIEFNSNGTATETVNGVVTISGKYSLFTSTKAPKVAFTLEKGVVYVEIKSADAKVKPVYYAIAEIEADNLFLQTSDKLTFKGFTKVK